LVGMICQFIPGYLLEQLSRSPEPDVAETGRRTRVIDNHIRDRRLATAPAPPTKTGAAWEVHDAKNAATLPGDLVRTAGGPEVRDVAVNEAATGITETLALFADLGRRSYDDEGATVVATVHYEKDYDNAFWDGTQLVFGDGDGTVFGRFTKPIDVLGHELSHAVTEFTANLTYQGQSGALNESVSDVFGACVKQRHLGQDAASADWLVGEGIFVAGVNGKALRSMESPGTAYDDPKLGRDPQVGQMSDYVQTTEDNGGVHINSGIPNRAFVLAAKAIGGDTWSGAGRIWYAALTSGLAAGSDFATFAAATVTAAGEHADAVSQAWATVGVTPGAASKASTAPQAPSSAVEVVRSGGVAGIRKHGSVDLDSDDPRAPRARELLDRVDFAAVQDPGPRPDRFTYHFRHRDAECTVPEPALTPDLRDLADLVLGD
jgi:Zn-dependent metalloprotease